MNLSLEFTNDELEMLEKYAKKHNISSSDFIKRAILERIKDENDMEVYESAINMYTKNPLSYSHSSVMRELGIAK